MHRELPRPRPRAWLQGTRPSLGRGHRDPARLPERSARELAAALACAVAAGAALEFFLDPRNGKRRRHLVRDRTTAAFRRQARKAQRQAHYEAGKIAGVTHAITHHEHPPLELDDVSLVRKVESELFRDRTIPKGPISINADRGIVVLRGQLEDPQQIQRIERDVRKIAGVRDVENLLPPARDPSAAKPSTRRPAHDPPACVKPTIKENDEPDLKQGAVTCLDVPVALRTIRSTARNAPRRALKKSFLWGTGARGLRRRDRCQ